MIKLFKFLLGFTITLIAIVVIAVAAALLFFDPNQHKDFIVAKVEQQTGRSFSLTGDIKLTYYPWLGLEAGGITLGNAKGFGNSPFLHADLVALRIKTMPLLKEHYELDTLRLHGVQVNLAKNKQGISNWQDLAGPQPAEATKEQEPLQLAAVVLGGVDIKDASLSWNDQSTGQTIKITHLNMTTGALSYGEPIDLTLSLKAEANKPAIRSDLTLKGTLNYDLDNERYSFKPIDLTATLAGKNVPGGSAMMKFKAGIEVNMADGTATISGLRLETLGTHITAELAASRIESGAPAATGEITVKGEDLARLAKVLEIEPAATELARLKDRSFNIGLKLNSDLSEDRVILSDLQAALLGTTVKGQLDAARVRSETPAVKGRIDIQGADLARLFKVAGIEPLGSTLAKLKQRSFKIKTDLDADLEKGRVHIAGLDARMLGATVKGAIDAGRIQSKTPVVKGNLRAAGPDLPTLLQIAGHFEGGKQPLLAKYGKQLAAIPKKQKAFSADVRFNADLKSGNVEVPALSLKTLGVTVSGNLTAREMQSKTGTVNGRLSVTGQNLSRVLRALDQKPLAEVLKAVKLETAIRGNRNDLNLKPMALSATFAGKQIPNSPVKLSLNADTNINLGAEKLKLDNFSLTGLGLNVQGSIDAGKILQAPEFTGRINVAPFDLRKLMRQLNQKPPLTADRKVLGKLALQTRFSGSTSNFNLEDLAFVLDDTHLKGDLSVSDFAHPAIQAAINIDGINADRYLPPQQKGKKPVTPEAAAGAAVQLPVETLRALNVKADLTIGKLILSNARMTNIKLSLNGKDGKIKLDPASADLYQGKYSGNITIDATGKLPRVTINSSLKGIQAEPLLKDVTGQGKMRGVGNFSAALTATGADTDTLKKTLNGKMSFSFRDGAIKGYNLGKIMRMGNQLQNNFRLKVSEQEETDFGELSGHPAVKNGIVTLDDLTGKSPALRISGTGILADLPRNSVNYKLTARLVATSKGQGGKDITPGKLEGVPLDCYLKGALDNPKRDCDASKLILAIGSKIIKGLLKLPGKLVPKGDQTQSTQQGQTQQQTTQQQTTQQQQQQAPNPVDEIKNKLKSLKSIFGK
ncbi:MAG: AsmA family protein [Gammaproteobacteria bacterium]